MVVDLPDAVGAEEAVDLAGADGEVEPVEGAEPAEVLDQAGDLDRVRSSRHPRYHSSRICETSECCRVSRMSDADRPAPRSSSSSPPPSSTPACPGCRRGCWRVLIADDEGASTAARLAEELQASPAAISGAVRYLSQVRLVVRHRRPGDRHDTWALHSDVWYEAVYSREGEVARWATLAREGVTRRGSGLARPVAGWLTPRPSSSSSRRRWPGCSTGGGPAAGPEPAALTSAGPGPRGSAPPRRRGRPRSGRCRRASGPAPRGGPGSGRGGTPAGPPRPAGRRTC